jgi:hypothetical protein
MSIESSNAAFNRLLELNENQPYSYDRDELVAMLDELLAPEDDEE